MKIKCSFIVFIMLITSIYLPFTASAATNVSRGTFANLVYPLLCVDGDYVARQVYSDVLTTDSYAEAVTLLYDLGIVFDGGTTFNPNSLVTREQGAVMLAKIFEERCGKNYAYGKDTFISDWFSIDKANRQYISVAATIGAVIYNETTLSFSPKSNLTDTEAQTIVSNVLNSITNNKNSTYQYDDNLAGNSSTVYNQIADLDEDLQNLGIVTAESTSTLTQLRTTADSIYQQLGSYLYINNYDILIEAEKQLELTNHVNLVSYSLNSPHINMSQVFRFNSSIFNISKVYINYNLLDSSLYDVNNNKILLDSDNFTQPGSYEITIEDTNGKSVTYIYDISNLEAETRYNNTVNKVTAGQWTTIGMTHGSSTTIAPANITVTRTNINDLKANAYFKFTNLPSGHHKIQFYKVNQALQARLINLQAEIYDTTGTHIVTVSPLTASGVKGYEYISNETYNFDANSYIKFTIAPSVTVNRDDCLFTIDSIILNGWYDEEALIEYFDQVVTVTPANVNQNYTGQSQVYTTSFVPDEIYVNNTLLNTGSYSINENKVLIDGSVFANSGNYTISFKNSNDEISYTASVTKSTAYTYYALTSNSSTSGISGNVITGGIWSTNLNSDWTDLSDTNMLYAARATISPTNNAVYAEYINLPVGKYRVEYFVPGNNASQSSNTRISDVNIEITDKNGTYQVSSIKESDFSVGHWHDLGVYTFSQSSANQYVKAIYSNTYSSADLFISYGVKFIPVDDDEFIDLYYNTGKENYLELINTAESASQMQTRVELYEDKFDVDTDALNNMDGVYNTLYGTQYTSLAEFKNAFNNAVKTYTTATEISLIQSLEDLRNTHSAFYLRASSVTSYSLLTSTRVSRPVYLYYNLGTLTNAAKLELSFNANSGITVTRVDISAGGAVTSLPVTANASPVTNTNDIAACTSFANGFTPVVSKTSVTAKGTNVTVDLSELLDTCVAANNTNVVIKIYSDTTSSSISNYKLKVYYDTTL